MATGYNWAWPQISSLTAMKYQRHGYVESKPFQPGDRKSARDGLERNVKGYRELRAELEKTRQDIGILQAVPQGGQLDKVGYYKSVVGTRLVMSALTSLSYVSISELPSWEDFTRVLLYPGSDFLPTLIFSTVGGMNLKF